MLKFKKALACVLTASAIISVTACGNSVSGTSDATTKTIAQSQFYGNSDSNKTTDNSTGNNNSASQYLKFKISF